MPRRRLLLTVSACGLLSALPAPVRADNEKAGCPSHAILVPAGADIQAMVDRAPEGAAFCLGSGTHRTPTIQPKAGQSFFGQADTVLNGSRRVTRFARAGALWVASYDAELEAQHGQCRHDAPACNLPDAVFIDDAPLAQLLTKHELRKGAFYIDRGEGRLYLGADPGLAKVEIAVATAAFAGTAPDVRISGLIVEKYATAAEKGAIQARHGRGWIIRDCEARLNSGGGIAVGMGTRVNGCDVHHNGQIGITGVGNGVVIEDNHIWANNTRGFDFRWEAGGAKVAASDDVTFRNNHVHDNGGPGLWCDVDCRNALYEGNTVERNADSGIFYEISFGAIIRGNRVGHNGTADRPWFWGADIVVAASENVQIYDNDVVADAGRCGIMLIDQNRRMKSDGTYKTQNNHVHDNALTFEGRGCAGGASDAAFGQENLLLIEEGGNTFDHNLYRVPQDSGPFRFAWGHQSYDWDDIRRMGIEINGRLLRY